MYLKFQALIDYWTRASIQLPTRCMRYLSFNFFSVYIICTRNLGYYVPHIYYYKIVCLVSTIIIFSLFMTNSIVSWWWFTSFWCRDNFREAGSHGQNQAWDDYCTNTGQIGGISTNFSLLIMSGKKVPCVKMGSIDEKLLSKSQSINYAVLKKMGGNTNPNFSTSIL